MDHDTTVAAKDSAIRRPGGRFTMKWMMAAVAVMALACWPIAYVKRRRAEFRKLAAYYASRVEGYTIASNRFHLTVFDKYGKLVLDRHLANKVFWHTMLRDKYGLAALRPWESVEPDNPDLVAAGIVDPPP
jgi:hypothetical protein